MISVHLWNQALADTSMLLIFVILAIGPLSRVHEPTKRLLSWRKELGIWSAVTAGLHTLIVLDLVARWDLTSLFIGTTGRANADIGGAFANVVGLIGLIYVVWLALISHRSGVALLGKQGWEYMQKKTHTLYALVVLHTAYFLFYRQLGRFGRFDSLLIPFLILIVALNILGWTVFVITVRKHKTKEETHMADLPPDNGGDKGAPRWVKIFGIVVGVLILLFVTLNLTGLTPSHGPGGGQGGDTPRRQH